MIVEATVEITVSELSDVPRTGGLTTAVVVKEEGGGGGDEEVVEEEGGGGGDEEGVGEEDGKLLVVGDGGGGGGEDEVVVGVVRAVEVLGVTTTNVCTMTVVVEALTQPTLPLQV